MRASLRHHLWAELRRGRARGLLRTGWRALAARHDLRLPARWDGPLLATLAVTYRCPLSCRACPVSRRAGAEMPDAALADWVDAIADLAPAGLGFTGGEPLLRRATLPAIEQAVRRRLLVHLNTSGLPIATPDAAARLLQSGVASINVSVDHPAAKVHDLLRGRDGSQRAALRAVELLAAARGQAGGRPRIQVVMAVAAATLDAVPALERLARAAGADALSLIPVHDFASAASRRAPWPRGRAPLPAPLRRARLENSRQYLRGILPFLEGAATPAGCSARRSALYVDPGGRVFPCTPAASAGGPGATATPTTLAALFRSGRLEQAVRPDLCGRCWWNCHRELDIALGRM